MTMSILGPMRPEIVRGITGENEVIPLTYHYIREDNLWNKTLEVLTQDEELTTYSVYVDEFERQIDILMDQGAYFATLEEVNYFRQIGEFPEKCVWISFDDADISVYEKAYPILKERGIPFSIFVIAGQVGSNDFNNLKICSWEQLREMRDSGLVSFGSHTYDMHYLEQGKAKFMYENNYEAFYKDIKESKKVLERELEVTIDSIAYPFGQASKDVIEIVQEAGYKSAYTLGQSPIDKESQSYYQSRYLINKTSFEKLGMNNIPSK